MECAAASRSRSRSTSSSRVAAMILLRFVSVAVISITSGRKEGAGMMGGFFFLPNFLSVKASWAVAKRLVRKRLGDEFGSVGEPSKVYMGVGAWRSVSWSEPLLRDRRALSVTYRTHRKCVTSERALVEFVYSSVKKSESGRERLKREVP